MGVPPSNGTNGESPRGSAEKALEDYVRHTKQVMEAASWPWPEHVLLQPKKMPRFVTTPAEFLRELQLGNHMNEIVVFPNGLRAIGQDRAVGAEIAKALGLEEQPPTAKTAYEVLERLADSGVLQSLKGKVAYRCKAEDRRDVPAGSSLNGSIAPKWEVLKEQCPEASHSSVYVSELRLLEAQRLEQGKRRKSTMQTTMRERAQQLGLQVENFLHWDDYSEGFFMGADNSGYGLHVDCIPSSNVGSVFAGHKLLAVWSYGEESRAVMKSHSRQLFVDPLSRPQVCALERACAVAIAPPGSIYVFSGASAHAVANVGFTAPTDGCPPRPSMVASSYEAFVGLHPRHAEVLVEACADAPDSDSDIEDFQDEVASQVKGMAWRLINNHIAEEDAARKAITLLRERCPRIGSVVEGLDEQLESLLDSCPRKRRRWRDSRRRRGRQATSSSSRSQAEEEEEEEDGQGGRAELR